jgi:hypothetical protein
LLAVRDGSSIETLSDGNHVDMTFCSVLNLATFGTSQDLFPLATAVYVDRTELLTSLLAGECDFLLGDRMSMLEQHLRMSISDQSKIRFVDPSTDKLGKKRGGR